MKFLLDSNIISEARKGARMNQGVRSWLEGVSEEDLALSVLVIGEIRHGIELKRRKDATSAQSLDHWLEAIVHNFENILPISLEVSEVWARMGVPNPVPVVDGLLAATAIVNNLIVVTRNEEDYQRTGASVLNPFM